MNSTRTERMMFPKIMSDRTTASASRMAAKLQNPTVAACSLVMLSKIARLVRAMPWGMSPMLTVPAAKSMAK